MGKNIGQLTICMLAILVSTLSCSPKSETPKETLLEEGTETTAMLRHVVMFKFADKTSPQEINTVETAFVNLQSEIEEIIDFEWGINNSPEGLDKGFTHCFVVTFEGEEGREIYLPHPAHQAFVELLKPHLADVLVLDYWAR